MKTLILALAISVTTFTLVSAAPVDSVASSRATSAPQTISDYLDQDVVAQRLSELGLSRATVEQRIARLSDTQLAALASEIELVQAGGTIQTTHVSSKSTLACIFKPLGRFFYDVYQLVFCWGKLS